MYMGRSRPHRRLSPANPARGLRVRTRRCITHEPPRWVPNRLGGSFDSVDAKAVRVTTNRPRRIQNPLLWGGGSYVRYSNQPPAQCKGRSDPFTEISPPASTTQRFGPLSPEDRARRVAELRTVLAAPRVPSPAPRRGTGGAAVNCPTTRYPTPAAVPWTGWGEGAPRGTQSKPSIPFAALPHELRKDSRLKGNRTAIVLAAALLEYARARDSCWPSNRRLAEDLGCCHQTIRNALAALQAAGWVRVEHGASNPTGRIIWLTWRAKQATPSNRLDPPLKPAGGIPLKPVEPEAKIVVVEEQEESPKFACERLRREIPPTPVASIVMGSPAPEPPPAPLAREGQPEPPLPRPAP